MACACNDPAKKAARDQRRKEQAAKRAELRMARVQTQEKKNATVQA